MTMDSGYERKANEIFSLSIYVVIIAGAASTVVGILVMRPVARFLGVTEDMLPYCVTYGRLSMMPMIPFMLQNLSHSFFVAAERPHYGLWATVMAGSTLMPLGVLSMVVFRWGVVSAGLAMVISGCVEGLVPLAYLACANGSELCTGAVIVLPIFLGLDGIWPSAVAAEALALVVTIRSIVRKRTKYHYA
ncbi:MAG: hypothetical protein IJR14_07010 [Synergistaceae bacterium]|nr:hypothetical protein [Synergistaceae bacterium]